MSHSAKKCKRGDPLGFILYILLQNIKKLERGTLLGHKKISEKKSHNAPKKSNPLVSTGFVGYVKKVKNERGTLLH